MAAVIQGRGDGDHINLVAEALHRCKYLERVFFETARGAAVAKKVARGCVEKVQGHWTARHAVHIWDRLELSRDQMETLRHLLSFIYNPKTDEYEPIKVWENEDDADDFVLSARIAGRWLCEGKYREIAQEMNIAVGANGRCERDA
eukprot:5028212-Prymnesium_polylepis.2